MAALDERIDKLLAMIERVVTMQAQPTPMPAIHVHVGPDTTSVDGADPRRQLAEMKKKKFAPLNDEENQGAPAEATRMPHPYVS